MSGTTQSKQTAPSPTLEAVVRLTRARHALDEIITDPHMPEELVLRANATANLINEYEVQWQLQLSVKESGERLVLTNKRPPVVVRTNRTLESDLLEDR